MRDTALGLVAARRRASNTPRAEDRPILEVLPLNTEQRQAVVQGLSAPLTVVTGPPGTGKSQVVTSLLANMAWQDGSVLFSSKNNHAVDVVESRVNDLGPFPLLLAPGQGRASRERIAQHLGHGAGRIVQRPMPRRGFAWLQRAHERGRARDSRPCSSEIAAVVRLRNRVDELERAAEPARVLFGEERFADLRSLDAGRHSPARCSRSRPRSTPRREAAPAMLMVRDCGETRRIAAHLGGGEAACRACELPASRRPAVAARDAQHRSLGGIPHNLLDERLALGRARAAPTGAASTRCARPPPLEQLARELTRIAEESRAQFARACGSAGCGLWPSRWDPEQRKLLSEYVSLLQMIASGDRYDEGAGQKVFRRYYSLFPKVTKILPCWAVTSLSARGRLPFEPGSSIWS